MRKPSFVAALTAAAALVAGFAAITAPASAETVRAETETDASGRADLFDTARHVRPIDRVRGPFFGLRVHSMDVGAEAKNVACFEYAARWLPTGDWLKYQLVRTAYEGRANPSDCDEVFGLVLPKDAGLKAEMGTTRWMRMRGPHGTPVGGFVGSLDLELVRDGLPANVVLASFRLAGTTGLRPMRGDPDDASKIDEGRCSAPRHDEGWYVGRLNRRVVRYLAQKAAEAGEKVDRETVLTLERSILAGTFEGRLVFEPSPEASAETATDTSILPTYDYCKIAKAAWWFDGLLAYEARARYRNPQPEPTRDEPRDAGTREDAGDPVARTRR